ncbi:ATP-utilizing phosphoenolpyruvate carboxykinase [Leucosporidium creatinivorum]|uniref:Phosphoenolpyruvate carboxykinase (ATP) n=1 Tax=Leucosporidium creatinivorum TaxID=106004 RepID=A0A1Y2FWH4_9BASI|nr:ATP-utilizing phosphoenolpyruvate carboxykinase [Leucosporidium creatinivorum]
MLLQANRRTLRLPKAAQHRLQHAAPAFSPPHLPTRPSPSTSAPSRFQRRAEQPVVHSKLPPRPPVALSEVDQQLAAAGFDTASFELKRNPSPAQLYEDAVKLEGAVISSSGALINFSGKKTGRSPKDKRIVLEDTSKDDIWWGPVNVAMSERSYGATRRRAIDFLNTRERLYVVDGFAGWDPLYRIKVRVVCARAYHALFMHNMLIRPTEDELKEFGEPDFTIYNAGKCPADVNLEGVTSETSVALNFKGKEMVILGTEYAGEMKKGIFSVMHYVQPVKFGNLSLHSSANEGPNGDVSLFFGLSGTGKTTLSADPSRHLIGDDEHVWADTGVFNIEGGCYAKCVGLDAEKEPDIYNAIRFGSILENVTYDEATREPNYEDISITENTRCAYPLHYISNAKSPASVTTQPSNLIYLTCDAFGVLPPVSLLTSEQAQYWFLSGYTARTPGTEDGVVEPIPTFSACFGAPFLTLHPSRYATMLAKRMQEQGTKCWLVNTGWTGGPVGVGSRCPIRITRSIIDAIHDDSLAKASFTPSPIFDLAVPDEIPGRDVPPELLDPRKVWSDKEAFDLQLRKLAGLFNEAFEQYAADCSPEVVAAGPRL